MKRFLVLLVSIALVGSLFSIPASAAPSFASGGNNRLDVLIQSTSPTDPLVDFIQSRGGTINYQYENVDVVAATVPAETLPEILAFPGVDQIEKDGLVTPVQLGGFSKDPTEPAAVEVESLAGLTFEAADLNALPDGYDNFLLTGALDVWEETGFGEGTLVAVVDTGTTPNVCLAHAVIGAPGFPDGYNATTDGVPATSPLNHYHGTHVAGVIASDCAITVAPGSPIYQAVNAYLPWGTTIPIVGQAPSAQIYPVKVFETSGAGSPTSVILDGLDHVLTLKNNGILDIDIVNMSLGGGTVWEGHDAYQVFVDALTSSNILVVSAGSNDGPAPNTVGSPAGSFNGISVGALDYAISSRILYEYIGLTNFLGAGQGLVMRPTGETRVANFSSRGPLSDGRAAPDISALGMWNFHAGPQNELRWASGTSFASPTVAGGAALLNAYWESMGSDTNPSVLRSVLLAGANPNIVGPAWQDVNEQGYGALDVMASLELLKIRPNIKLNALRSKALKPNILGNPRHNNIEVYESDTITLGASENYDLYFQINKFTSSVTIEVFDVSAPDNSDYAFWPNALEFHLKSAIRTAVESPIAGYWYPYFFGDSFTIQVNDGSWTVDGVEEFYQPMQPGLMRFSLIGDYSNESPVSFRVRITRENFRTPLKKPVSKGTINMDETFLVPFEIPEGTNRATLDLVWHRDWTMFPTSDLDVLVFDPGFSTVLVDGATFNSPERVVLEEPAAGTWFALVMGFEIYRTDNYELFLTLE